MNTGEKCTGEECMDVFTKKILCDFAHLYK